MESRGREGRAENGRMLNLNSVRIDEIQIGDRFRKDLGDISGLAASIADIGLLHPVVITPDKYLIAGQRRIAACRSLGWIEVPVNIVDLAQVERGEYDENTCRKDFTPSEAVAIWHAMEDNRSTLVHNLCTTVDYKGTGNNKRLAGLWLAFLPGTDVKEAKAAFKSRFGVEPVEIHIAGPVLLLGPVDSHRLPEGQGQIEP